MTPAEHSARIREALEVVWADSEGTCSYLLADNVREPALASLAALEDSVASLTRERDKALGAPTSGSTRWVRLMERAERAEAERDRLAAALQEAQTAGDKLAERLTMHVAMAREGAEYPEDKCQLCQKALEKWEALAGVVSPPKGET